jgi:prepilin-type N-terminal cleavage/methylation domain-containing protein
MSDQKFPRLVHTRLERDTVHSWFGKSIQTQPDSENGFTLIELIVVIAVMPILIGAFAMGLIAVFSLQTGVSSRLSDAGDAQVVSVNFEKDVQSSTLFTTNSASTSPSPCGSGTQILGIQLGQYGQGSNWISYSVLSEGAKGQGGTSLFSLVRNECQVGSATVNTSVVSRDVPSNQAAAITCAATPASVAAECANQTYKTSWIPVTGITGISLAVNEPNSRYQYTLVAIPNASTNTIQASTFGLSPPGCFFATPGTGTYASSLCFVDFSAWNLQTSAPGVTCSTGYLGMSVGITGTPYTMTFCINISTVAGGAAVTGTGALGVGGYNGVKAVALPTYSDPVGDGSEAFLGNNGFYTGVQGNPALYTTTQGSTSTVTINNINVLDAEGDSISGWELVTGDAESTDNHESITWSSNAILNLLANSPSSPVGNACESVTPTYNTQFLTGIPGYKVECSANSQVDKTGTVMLEAVHPTSLTVTMVGAGLQATFIGLLLQ